MPERVSATSQQSRNGVALDDPLTIAGRTLRSRLLLGTGGFSSLALLADAIAASGTELVTVALRRIDPSARGSLVDVIDETGVGLLPKHKRRRSGKPGTTLFHQRRWRRQLQWH